MVYNDFFLQKLLLSWCSDFDPKWCFWKDICPIIYLFHKHRQDVAQWAKMKKIFQRGESPRYCHFPSETTLVMVKYQKLAKSVGGNWGFWIIFDFKKSRLLFRGFKSWLCRWRFRIDCNISLIFLTLYFMTCNQ